MVPERRVLSEYLRVADVTVMLLALALAMFLTQSQATEMSLVEFLTTKIRPVNLVLLACLCLFWPVLLDETDVIRPWRFRSLGAELKAVFKAACYGALVLLVLVVLFRRGNVAPSTIAAFWMLTLAGTLLVHLSFHVLARNLRGAWEWRHVLIVGSGPRARRLAKALAEHGDVVGYHLLGFVDDPDAPHLVNGGKLVCSLADLPAFLRDHVVDEVVVALPIKSRYQSILDVSMMCEEQGIPVRIPSDLFDLRIANRAVSELGDESLLTFYTGAPPKPWSLVAKRTLDVGISAVLLVLLAPVLLLVAAAIKLTSPGPVLFRQERMGINKRRFQVVKFRTMVQDAESKLAELEAMNETDGPAFKLRDDPRLTPIGRFLRTTSVDELPQLINVVKGEMSLVGPRPLAVRDAMGISQNWQKRRFTVKPGITGLWQVNGRSNVRFQDWMNMDLEYIDKWSLGLDLKILLKTVPAVLRGEGAA